MKKWGVLLLIIFSACLIKADAESTPTKVITVSCPTIKDTLHNKQNIYTKDSEGNVIRWKVELAQGQALTVDTSKNDENNMSQYYFAKALSGFPGVVKLVCTGGLTDNDDTTYILTAHALYGSCDTVDAMFQCQAT